MLKNSARNSSAVLSVIFVFLITAKSNSAKSGPLRIFRPASPKVPGAGTANAFGLNQQVIVPTGDPFGQVPAFGLPMMSGRWLLTMDCVPALSNASTGVNGTLL